MTLRPFSRGTSTTPSSLARANGTESAEAPVQVIQRLHWRAVDPYLEVEMVPGRRAGGADPPDHVPPMHLLPHVHQDRGLVPVAGGQPLALVLTVVDAGVVAVPAAPTGLDHPPVVAGVDRAALRRGQVDPG